MCTKQLITEQFTVIIQLCFRYYLDMIITAPLPKILVAQRCYGRLYPKILRKKLKADLWFFSTELEFKAQKPPIFSNVEALLFQVVVVKDFILRAILLARPFCK